jgi:hypothetical protein
MTVLADLLDLAQLGASSDRFKGRIYWDFRQDDAQ